MGKERLRIALPSPALILAFLALVLAVGGGAFAIASSNSKQVRRIANKVVSKRAHRLSVRHAKRADTATLADHATAADTATDALNAGATGGMHLAKLDARMPPGGNATVFNANGLTLIATCSGANELNLTATTSVANAEILEQGGYASTFHAGGSYEFDPGDVEQVGATMGDGTQDNISGLVIYSTPTGAVVTITLSISETPHGDVPGCDVEGSAIYS
jgi:hypothetical protein